MKEIKKLRDKISPETLLLGNGDAKDLPDAKEKAENSGADGVMLGRAIFGNPWLFDENKKQVSIREKLEVMLEHTKLFEEVLSPHKNFAIMKKHYKAYVNDFPGAKELRVALMSAENYSKVQDITRKFLAGIDASHEGDIIGP
jgi:tRNA-dihydrouridine synthase